MSRLQRRLLLGCLMVTVPIAIASAAFACIARVTLTLHPESGPSGTSIRLTGEGFSLSPTAPAIEVHLDSRTGPVLAETRADSSGRIEATFVIPSDTPVGYHVFIATQTDNGEATAGTPARASFQVVPASASSSAAPFGPGHPHETGHPGRGGGHDAGFPGGGGGSMSVLPTVFTPVGMVTSLALALIVIVVPRARSALRRSA